MGKSQRRRATRKSHHESAAGRPETNGRVSETPGSPREPVLDDLQLVPKHQYDPLFWILLGVQCGFVLYPSGQSPPFKNADRRRWGIEHFDVMHTINTEGLLALQNWFVVLGVVLGVALDWVLVIITFFVGCLTNHYLSTSVRLAVVYYYSLPLFYSMLRITAWDASCYIVQMLDAPTPLRCLGAACTNYLIYYCFFAEAWTPVSSYIAPLALGGPLLLLFGPTGSHFLFLIVILRTFGVPRVIGFLVVAGIVSTIAYHDIFCGRELAELINLEDGIVTATAPVRKRPRFETNAARQGRWAYWRLYYSKRGNEAALKRLGKLERRACDVCGRQADVDEPRCAVCDGCGDRRYCGVHCQRADWTRDKHSEKCSGASR